MDNRQKGRTSLRKDDFYTCFYGLTALQGGLVPSKISGVGTNFGLLVPSRSWVLGSNLTPKKYPKLYMAITSGHR
jgi:hypothetical protein